MRRARFAVVALGFAASCIGQPAPASAMFPFDVIPGLLGVPFGGVPYYQRHHRYGHYRFARRLPLRPPHEPAIAAETRGAVMPGRWEFSSQLLTTSQGIGGLQTVQTRCISPTLAVPVEQAPQCKLDSVQRDGARLAWSMTCSNSRNTVRSDGMADYHGSTMEATLVSHLPGANGSLTDLTRRITGRYLGPCTQPPTIAAAEPAPSGGATPLRPDPSSGNAIRGAGR